jgi:hypothetical protein
MSRVGNASIVGIPSEIEPGGECRRHSLVSNS